LFYGNRGTKFPDKVPAEHDPMFTDAFVEVLPTIKIAS
jgi:hypothetical protein